MHLPVGVQRLSPCFDAPGTDSIRVALEYCLRHWSRLLNSGDVGNGPSSSPGWPANVARPHARRCGPDPDRPSVRLFVNSRASEPHGGACALQPGLFYMYTCLLAHKSVYKRSRRVERGDIHPDHLHPSHPDSSSTCLDLTLHLPTKLSLLESSSSLTLQCSRPALGLQSRHNIRQVASQPPARSS